MSEIVASRARRRRPPSKKLIIALAWVVYSLAVLAWSVILIAKGYGNDPWVLIGGCSALAIVPYEWATIKREMDRWRNG